MAEHFSNIVVNHLVNIMVTTIAAQHKLRHGRAGINVEMRHPPIQGTSEPVPDPSSPVLVSHGGVGFSHRFGRQARALSCRACMVLHVAPNGRVRVKTISRAIHTPITNMLGCVEISHSPEQSAIQLRFNSAGLTIQEPYCPGTCRSREGACASRGITKARAAHGEAKVRT